MAAPVFLLWPLVLGQVAFVEADAGDCPAAGEVEARVRGILGLKAGEALEERATLLRDGEALKIVVRRKDGSVLGEKLLSATASCQELEALASVVVASWISDLHPEFVATLPPAPSRGEMPGSEADGAEQANASPSATPSAAEAPQPTKKPEATQAPAKPGQPWHFELGAAAGVAITSSEATLLGSLGARWVPERLGFGAAIAIHAMAPRATPLSMGNVDYWRWPLAVGPVLRVPLGAVRLDLHAAPVLGWLHAEGRDFKPSLTRNVFRSGGLLGLRASYGPGRWHGFFEASGVAWGETEAFIERGEEVLSVALPSVELYLALGVDFAL